MGMDKYCVNFSQITSVSFKFACEQLIRIVQDGRHESISSVLSLLETIRKVVASYVFAVNMEKTFA